MNRGTILLCADNLLEAQIITSFLQAADYQVVDFVAHKASTLDKAVRFDVAVVVLNRWESSPGEAFRQLRQANLENLPIVAVVAETATENDPSAQILSRPIRLFELAKAIEDAIHTNPPGLEADSRENSQFERDESTLGVGNGRLKK